MKLPPSLKKSISDIVDLIGNQHMVDTPIEETPIEETIVESKEALEVLSKPIELREYKPRGLYKEDTPTLKLMKNAIKTSIYGESIEYTPIESTSYTKQEQVDDNEPLTKEYKEILEEMNAKKNKLKQVVDDIAKDVVAKHKYKYIEESIEPMDSTSYTKNYME